MFNNKPKTPEGAFMYEIFDLLAPLLGGLASRMGGGKDSLILRAALLQKGPIIAGLEAHDGTRRTIRQIIDIAARYKSSGLPEPPHEP